MCPCTTLECALLEIWLCRPRNNDKGVSGNYHDNEGAGDVQQHHCDDNDEGTGDTQQYNNNDDDNEGAGDVQQHAHHHNTHVHP